jgi:23S rRNA pseudouridine955/2504/2580 synthase
MARKEKSLLHPRVRVIHQDETLWVLDKPPGVLSHPNPPEEESKSALVRAPYDFEREAYWITGEDGRRRQLHLVHRLDQDTSGLILCTMSSEAAAVLKEALYRHEMKKEYRALVLGIPHPPEGIWRDALVKASGKGQARVTVAPGGRPNAETRYRTLKLFPKAGAALLQLDPETGRTHQLRVQTASRKLPIAGDERYGDFAANQRLVELIGLRRMFLHAHRLELRHPRSGHRMVFTAELTGPLAGPLERIALLGERVRTEERRRN